MIAIAFYIEQDCCTVVKKRTRAKKIESDMKRGSRIIKSIAMIQIINYYCVESIFVVVHPLLVCCQLVVVCEVIMENKKSVTHVQ
jgi:hypothetical protein